MKELGLFLALASTLDPMIAIQTITSVGRSFHNFDDALAIDSPSLLSPVRGLFRRTRGLQAAAAFCSGYARTKRWRRVRPHDRPPPLASQRQQLKPASRAFCFPPCLS